MRSETEWDADGFDEAYFADDLDFALGHVCDLPSDQVPTTAELHGVFGAMKQSCAESDGAHPTR